MNERIKELSLQASDSIPDEVSAEHAMYLFQKKFAELIVKECMQVADEGMAQVTMRVEWPSYHIKKHFGVE